MSWMNFADGEKYEEPVLLTTEKAKDFKRPQ